MASTTIDQVAVALVAVIDAMPQTIKGFKWQQADLDVVPGGIVGLPRIERTSPQGAEPQIGSLGWSMIFPVSFFVDYDEPNRAAVEIVDLVESFVKAIDADETLGGLDGVGHNGPPRVTLSEASLENSEQERPLLTYDLEVEVPRLVL